jgi:uncharacterized protein YggU (UPF0235/DUF167 family)
MKKNFELFKYDPAKKRLTIGIKVKAGAKENSIGGFIFMDGKAWLKISIKAIAEGGKANLMITAYLSKQWKIPGNDTRIIQGLTGSYKIIALKNIEKEYMEKLLIEKLPGV